MRARRASYNFAAYAISFLVNAIVVLIASPILLNGLGAVNFGIWKTAQKIFDVVSVTDGRAGQALKMLIARAEGRFDEDKYKTDSVGAAVIIWALFVPLSVTVLGAIYINRAVFFGVEESFLLSSDLNYLYLFLSFSFLISPLVSIPDAVLMGVNRGYKSIVIQMAGIVAANIAMVFAVKCGGGLVEVGLISVVSTVCVSVVIFYVVKRTVSWFSASIPDFDLVKEQGRTTGFITVWLLVEKILLSADMIMVGALFGPAMAAAFSFMTYVPMLALSLVLIVCTSITPGLAAKLVEGGDEGKKIIGVVREIVFAASTLFSLVYLIFNKSFVANWVGGGMLLDQGVCVFLAISLIQVSHARSEAQMQDMVLAAKSRVWIGLLGVGLGFVFSFLCYGLFEENKILGVVAGGVLGRSIITYAYPKITNKEILVDSVSVVFYVKILILFFVFCVLSFFAPIFSLLQMIIFAPLFFLGMFFVFLFFVFSIDSRRYLFGRCATIFKS